MNTEELIDQMKQDSLVRATDHAIPINGSVSLVPIGNWIMNNQQFIQAMADWRFQSRDSFFARFPLSTDTFSTYLQNHSIGNSGNITFVLMDADGILHGHMGLSQVKEGRAHIDAVVIRPQSRGGGLAKSGLESLVRWGRDNLGVSVFDLEVLSSNHGALSLYAGMGFTVAEKSHLRETHEGVITSLVECEEKDANVEEFKLLMSRDFN